MRVRLLVATVLSFAALAAPAGAKYLHLADAKPAANQYAQLLSNASTYSDTVGRCWHAGPHVVQCSLTEDARYSGTFTNVAIIALHGNALYGHVLHPDEAGPAFNRPRFIKRLSAG